MPLVPKRKPPWASLYRQLGFHLHLHLHLHHLHFPTVWNDVGMTLDDTGMTLETDLSVRWSCFYPMMGRSITWFSMPCDWLPVEINVRSWYWCDWFRIGGLFRRGPKSGRREDDNFLESFWQTVLKGSFVECFPVLHLFLQLTAPPSVVRCVHRPPW